MSDLPDTQQRSRRRSRKSRSEALPGPDDGGEPSPADGAPPDGPLEDRPDQSLPREGRAPDASEDVAGGRASTGAVLEEPRPLQRPVPLVSPGEWASTDPNPRFEADGLSQSVGNALAKAEIGEWWRTVAWQPDRQAWAVPSRTTPGAYYLVRRRYVEAKGKWWDILRCDCPTETVGRRVCWHKAAVFLRWQNTRTLKGARWP